MKYFISLLIVFNLLFAQTDFEKRAEDLVSKMTLEEKVGEMVHPASGIPRLGIDPYNWWNECLHGVARNGIATVFPQAIGLASTWNTNLIFVVADVISTEGRAKHHEALRNNDFGQYKGLTFWTPNINIFRDPRWGRGQETYGEDPFLTGKIGVAFVKGIQGDNPTYFKAIATAKHYVVHSGPEPDRHHFNAICSEKDMFDTYMPAFEALVKDAKVYSIMGAYNRTNGEACCGSDYLLNDILRKQWGFDGYVVSDCGAIGDIWKHHKLVATAPEAAAMAVKNGCELNCGDTYPHLLDAVKMGLISEEEIDIAVKRLMLARLKLGMFDDPKVVPYADIPYSKNACDDHQKLALKTAQESIVLLKNNDLLPLSKNIKSIAVVGPNADDLDVLYGNYNGFAENPVTILQGIKNKIGSSAKVEYTEGCRLAAFSKTDILPVPSECLSNDEGTGLVGEYFDNMTLAGGPVFKRIDKKINFDWAESKIHPKIGNDNYSVRWTGYLTPKESGTYSLGAKTDDGMRIYLDGKLIVENWKDQAAATFAKTVDLKANKKYTIKFEYYENQGGAFCMLGWAQPNTMQEVDKIAADKRKRAVDLANKSDVVVMVGGISPRLEGEEMPVKIDGFEGGDRTSLNLPAPQRQLLKDLNATGKPVVLVLMNGSALAINWANEHIPAILTAGYPGQEGGNAVADVLFGDYNPGGRLPVTYYKSVEDLPPFDDYAMKNRTYRYFDGEVLYPFGYGLSFTKFDYKNLTLSERSVSEGETFEVKLKIKNIGNYDGDEVVQVYIKKDKSKNWLENRRLVGFQRLHIKKGESANAIIPIKTKDFRVYDEILGDYTVEKGDYILMVGKSSKNILLIKKIKIK